jgi:nitric oxide reductase NorD protein
LSDPLSIAPANAIGGSHARDRLRARLRGYDDLAIAFDAAQLALEKSDQGCDSWLETILGLLEANLGASTLRAFLRISGTWPRDRAVTDLVTLGDTVRHVGRESGSANAQAILAHLPQSLRQLTKPGDLKIVLAALGLLAEQAPESLPLVAARLERLLAQVDAEGFRIWLSGGLASCGRSAAKRRAYFGLDDPLSLRLLNSGTRAHFTTLERRLAAGIKAMWNKLPPLRTLQASRELPVPKRVSLIGGVVRFPESFPGLEHKAVDLMYRAAAAHAGAHLVYSTTPFPLGQLKPLQVALVSLVEDARVETLALREMPGLARLWQPFHTAQASDAATVQSLMARLARALIDSCYVDDHAWVSKGRTLFATAQNRLSDPNISREIGGLLGNDIGQTRMQFNPRSYVVEPAYRDDNMGLWDFGDQPDAPTEEIATGSARVERREQPEGGRHDQQPRDDGVSRARLKETAVLDGIPVATYPEWDHMLGQERPDWTTIVETTIAPAGDFSQGSGRSDLARRVAAVTRAVSIGRRTREKGLRDGDTLDLDACVAAMVERRSGLIQEERVFQRETTGPRDLSILLLLDLSQSTADKDRSGRSILAVEKEAATAMASALEAAGDTLAIHGFSSDGRENVRYLRLKEFAEPFDDVVHARLARLTSSHSTRLGAAIRHAGKQLARQRAFRRALLVLTDGEPSDVDVTDPLHLTEDARRAVLSVRKTGVDVFAFGVGAGPFRSLDRIVGERRALRVPRIETLPARLMQLFAELKK